MKKRILLIIIFFIIGSVLVYIFTNHKIEKWTYDLLPNNYAIKKTGETDVVLGKYIDGIFEVDTDNQIGVSDYIAEFAYGERYIALKCLTTNNDGVNVIFYIIDTNLDNIYGPYDNEETYNAVVEKIVDEELSDWIKTTTKPENAINK